MEGAKEILEKLGVENLEYHIFLCTDPSKPKCASREETIESWEYLKKRLEELGLSSTGKVFRTRANCLRVCKEGPIMCIYPEGRWFKNATKDVIELILQNYIVNKNEEAIKEYIIR